MKRTNNPTARAGFSNDQDQEVTPTPTSPFILDFGTGAPLRLDLKLSSGEITAQELLPAIFTVADAIHAHTEETIRDMGKIISCGPRCSACCKQLIPVSEYEAAHLAGVVRRMPLEQRRRTIGRFTAAMKTLDGADLLSPINKVFAHDLLDESTVTYLKKQYWKLGIPCPFLEDDLCSVHAHRPLACRQYMVTSSPEHCRSLYTANECHEVVLHTVDTGGALAAFSGEGIRETRILPHILSLLAERSIRSRPHPMLPAAQMMGRYLNLIATGFTRRD